MRTIRFFEKDPKTHIQMFLPKSKNHPTPVDTHVSG
jgi:hypothetical protein